MLSEYVEILRKRWLTVALMAFGVIVATALATLASTPMFSASTRMFFAVQGGNSISELSQGSSFTQSQLVSYAEVATSPIVLDPVIDELGLALSAVELSEHLEVAVPLDTVILEIGVSWDDPATAAELANAVASQLQAATTSLSPDNADGSESVTATVLSQAVAPDNPSSPRVSQNLLLGTVFGIGLGLGAAILRERWDTKVRSERDVASVSDTAVIGSVPYEKEDATTPGARIFLSHDPRGLRSEAIRRLRTNLQYVELANSRNSFVVTSSLENEGKSTIAINLAVAMAEAGARVVLVDADLRKPSIAQYLGIEGRVGLTTVLIGRAELQDVLHPWRGSSLDILTSGQIPPNPSELLGSRAMMAVLDQLTRAYDMVILDSSPLLPVTDAAVLGRMAGGTIVVAGTDGIRKGELAQSLSGLEVAGARALGVVLNKVQDGERRQYYYDSESKQSVGQVFLPGDADSPRSTWPGRPLAGGK